MLFFVFMDAQYLQLLPFRRSLLLKFIAYRLAKYPLSSTIYG